MAQRMMWLAVAGALGTLARYGLSVAAQQGRAGFPWGTLAVNALGCLLFGMIWQLAARRILLGDEVRFIVLVGFMGAFTTFSSFAFDTVEMMRQSKWALAAVNVGIQNGLGIAMLLAGLALGDLMAGGKQP